MLCRCCGKGRVIRVDISDLNIDETLSVGRSRAEAFTQQLRDSLDKLGMQPWETLQFLKNGVYVSTELNRFWGIHPRDDSTELVQLWQILTSSSYTSSTHRRLGASRSLIWGLTSRSNATSGTNRDGRGPVEFRIAVRMSWFSRACVESIFASAWPKTSLKM